uniref:Uncharacterized protein n=1 Tax=viral metagenome TaxID=1070528 RepID=A0A6C0LZ05_9ZZZZ
MNATETIVSRLLKEEPFKSTLMDYTLLTSDNFNLLQKGMHIKYITLDEELKNAGTYLGLDKPEKLCKCHLRIMGAIVYKLRFSKNFIFFKEKQFDFRDFMRRIASGEVKISIKKSG